MSLSNVGFPSAETSAENAAVNPATKLAPANDPASGKKSVKVPRLGLKPLAAQATPKSPRALRSPRAEKNSPPSPPKSEADKQEAAKSHVEREKQGAHTDRSSPEQSSSMPSLRIRRSAVTLPGSLFAPSSTATSSASAVQPVSSPRGAVQVSAVASSGLSPRPVNAPLVSTSSAPASTAAVTVLRDTTAQTPRDKSAAYSLVDVLVNDSVSAIRNGRNVPDHVDRAFALASLPAPLKALVRDKTMSYVPTQLLLSLIFGGRLEQSEGWKTVLSIRAEITRADSLRQVTDDGMKPDMIAHARSMFQPWADRMAKVMLGNSSDDSLSGLPPEVLGFLVRLDNSLHAALMEAVPPLNSEQINQHRFAMLHRILVERLLLPANDKLNSKPPTQLQAWFGEALRDSLQEKFLESAKGFFQRTFKLAPDTLRSAIMKRIAAEIRDREQAKVDARKKLVIERVASLQRRTPRGHTRSNSDSVAKFEDIKKQKARESSAKKVLAEVLAKLDLHAVPEGVLDRINKGFRAFVSTDTTQTEREVLRYIRDSVNDYVGEHTLLASEQQAVKRLVGDIAQRLEEELQAKAERRATRVTASLDRGFLDRIFSKEQQLGTMLETVTEVEFVPGDEPVSERSIDSGISGTSGTSSTSSTPSTSSGQDRSLEQGAELAAKSSPTVSDASDEK